MNERKGLNLKEMRRGPTVFFQGLWPMVLFAKRVPLQKCNRTLGSAWMLLGVCWFASFVCSGVLTVGISIGTHTTLLHDTCENTRVFNEGEDTILLS